MLLGADQLGRDMFSRIIYGARNTVGLALGGDDRWPSSWGRSRGFWRPRPRAAGSISSWAGRGRDHVDPVADLRAADAVDLRHQPRCAMVIIVGDHLLAARLPPDPGGRGQRRGDGLYRGGQAARRGHWYLIRREILPNSTAPLIAEFGLEFCFVFLLIAGLSFLGLGIQPPTADWGSMVRENATLISFGDITPLIPAAAIALLTVAVNFVVDWMLHRSSGLKE
jgi:peptide/nickel transport system permease protein